MGYYNFFNSPINEEQAWAVCFQCAQYYLRNPSHDQYQVLVEHGLQSMFLNTGCDVLIHCFESNDCERDVLERHINMTRKKGVAEFDGVQSLGRVIFEALDYGIDEAKKHPLSHELETLIEFMTHWWYDNCEEGGDTGSQCADDEGVEKYTMEEHHCTFGEVARLCAQHLSSRQDANYHYRAVCQALFSEVTELKTLLEKIEHSREQLKQVSEAEECRFLASREQTVHGYGYRLCTLCGKEYVSRSVSMSLMSAELHLRLS